MDLLVSCGPTTTSRRLHGLGRRHETAGDLGEVGVGVIQAEDQAAGADPAQRQPGARR
jgi:hypothetical protein